MLINSEKVQSRERDAILLKSLVGPPPLKSGSESPRRSPRKPSISVHSDRTALHFRVFFTHSHRHTSPEEPELHTWAACLWQEALLPKVSHCHIFIKCLQIVVNFSTSYKNMSISFIAVFELCIICWVMEGLTV